MRMQEDSSILVSAVAQRGKRDPVYWGLGRIRRYLTRLKSQNDTRFVSEVQDVFGKRGLVESTRIRTVVRSQK